MSADDDLLLLFDYNRHGLHHIATSILLYLDYRSFVRYKRTCRTVHNYILSSGVEEVKLRYKLQRDWRHGEAREAVMKIPQEEDGLPRTLPSVVTNVMEVDGGNQVLASVDKTVYLWDIKTGACVREFVNTTENFEKNVITRFDVIVHRGGKYLVSGSTNGVLSIWNLLTGEIVNSKQLFGIISGVKCRQDTLPISPLFRFPFAPFSRSPFPPFPYI